MLRKACPSAIQSITKPHKIAPNENRVSALSSRRTNDLNMARPSNMKFVQVIHNNLNATAKQTHLFYQSFIYSPTDALVSCLKKQY